MGLDSVELVMAIEDEFGIVIPDADAAQLAVLGAMHGFIVRALRERGDTPDDDQVWERLRNVVVKQLGVRPGEVTPSAHIVEDLHAD
jgi:acyl carrier protein